jgi:hypothetical protein
MRSDRTSESSTLPDVPITKITAEKKSSQRGKSKEKSPELFNSLTSKVKELLRIKDDLQGTIACPEIEIKHEERTTGKQLQEELLTEDGVIEPELNYRLSSLLDFLRQLHGFEDCGVYLLNEGNTALETLVISPGTNSYENQLEFEDEVSALWRSGRIGQAIDQMRKLVLTSPKQGNLLVMPFKALDQKYGFWVAHFRKSVSLERKSSEELLFWTELVSSCVENHLFKQYAQLPRKEKGIYEDSEKLFSAVQLTRAMVHEVNNSLQVILGRAQLFKINERKSSSGSSIIKGLETIETSSNQACSVLKDFSDYLHRQFDEVTDSKEVNLPHILKSNLALISYILKSKQIKLHLDINEDISSVRGNPAKLEQAFLALIWEVKDLLASGGEVHMSMRAEGEWFHLNIECQAKESLGYECRNSADFESRSRLNNICRTLTSYGGELKAEKWDDLKVRFDLRFPVAAKTAVRGQDVVG